QLRAGAEHAAGWHDAVRRLRHRRGVGGAGDEDDLAVLRGAAGGPADGHLRAGVLDVAAGPAAEVSGWLTPGALHTVRAGAHVLRWQVVESQGNAITLALQHPPGTDWPWAVLARQSLVLDEAGLAAALDIRNVGDTPMPVGGGFHPFFARPPGLRIQFDAAH